MHIAVHTRWKRAIFTFTLDARTQAAGRLLVTPVYIHSIRQSNALQGYLRYCPYACLETKSAFSRRTVKTIYPKPRWPLPPFSQFPSCPGSVAMADLRSRRCSVDDPDRRVSLLPPRLRCVDFVHDAIDGHGPRRWRSWCRRCPSVGLGGSRQRLQFVRRHLRTLSFFR